MVQLSKTWSLVTELRGRFAWDSKFYCVDCVALNTSGGISLSWIPKLIFTFNRDILILSWLLMQMLGDSAICKGTSSLFNYEKNSDDTWFFQTSNLTWSTQRFLADPNIKIANHYRSIFLLVRFGKLAALLPYFPLCSWTLSSNLISLSVKIQIFRLLE